MRLAGLTLFLLTTAGLMLATFVPLIEMNAWWVRMADFPRLQYLIFAVVLLILLGIARIVNARWRLGLAVIVGLTIAYNGFKLYPYLFAKSLSEIIFFSGKAFGASNELRPIVRMPAHFGSGIPSPWPNGDSD